MNIAKTILLTTCITLLNHAVDAADNFLCGCSSCTDEVLNREVTDHSGTHSCANRINWLLTNGGFSNEEHACAQVAHIEFSEECGGCDPLNCNGESTVCRAATREELQNRAWPTSDPNCDKCAHGYRWWPCDTQNPSLCNCERVGTTTISENNSMNSPAPSIDISSGPSSSPTKSARPSTVPSASPTGMPTISSKPSVSSDLSINLVCEGLELLQNYNLITLGDMDTNSEVEGSTFVGGDLTSSSSSNYCTKLSDIPSTTPCLEVVGSVQNGNPIQVNHASAVFNSQTNTVSFTNPAIQYTVNGRAFNMNGGNSGATATTEESIVLSQKKADITAQLETLSIYLSTFSDNSGNYVSIPGNQPASFKLQANSKDNDGVSIFNIAASDLFSNSRVQQIEIKNHVDADMILINVSGKTVIFNSGNMVGPWLTSSDGRSKTLWNFYEATSIDFTSKNMMGAVLAPKANVQTGHLIDGATAVRSLETTSEIHLPLLEGICPTPQQ